MADDPMRRTPLHDTHRALGARLVPFAGWEMPVQYTSILDEARAVRTAVGLFDISHMGRVRFEGAGALDLLQKVTSNDVASLRPGQAQYSLLTNPQGGIVDDLIVYRTCGEAFLVVMNASNTAKDLAWIRSHTPPACRITDTTADTAMIAVQGPLAPKLVAGMADGDLLALDRFELTDGRLRDHRATFCRTGYTGEDGFELIVGADDAAGVWQALQSGGAVPCGLGARDVLRTEAGYPLYGHEIDDTTTPVEAGLMWVVKPAKGDFIGRDAILSAREKGAGRRLVGITLAERVVPRQGYTLLADDREVGTVTSGVFSPTRGCGLGMAYVADPHGKAGTVLQLRVRNALYPATVVPKKDLLGR